GWRYLHQGGRCEAVTGLYAIRNRDLSPALGRWIEVDPRGFTAGDTNFYRAEGNNPVNELDPSGLDWLNAAKQTLGQVWDTLGPYARFRSAIRDYEGYRAAGEDRFSAALLATLYNAPLTGAGFKLAEAYYGESLA